MEGNDGTWAGWNGIDDLQALQELGRRLEWPLHRAARKARQLLIRTLLKIRNKNGVLVPLRHNRAQAEFAANATGRDIVLKARQLGITTWIAARFFVATISRPGTVTVLVAHDQRAVEEIFRIVHRFLEYLPRRLRRGALITSRDNIGQIVFPQLDSEYRVESAADPNAGRGLTIQYLHCSEVARWPRDAAATLASLRAAVPPSGKIVLESTPNGAGGCFYDEWQRAEASGYKRHFFPWWYEPAYRVDGRGLLVDGHDGIGCAIAHRPATIDELNSEERALVAEQGLTIEQIAFRRRIRESFRGLARQEFAEDPISCFISSGECVFDLEVLERRLTECSAGSVRPVETRDNGRLLIWWPARSGAEYIIGVDPAGGGCEGDYSCVQLIERVTGLQCAELHGHLPPQELATRLAELGREYNDALIAVERNNHGHGVIAYLAAYEKYPRLYEQNRQVGWLTTAVTRPRMIELFAALVARQPGLFASQRLLAECRTFVRQVDGSAAATAGAHDDCVLAMAIAQAVRLELAGGHRPAPDPDFASLAR